jgi:hypothetical protein
MSYVVDVLLSIPCGGPESVPAVARALVPALSAEAAARARAAGKDPAWDWPPGWNEALGLLEYLAAGRGFAPGSRGRTFSWGLFNWDVGGNSFDVAAFVEVLRPFWQELLRRRRQDEEGGWGGPSPTTQLLLLCEGENDEHGSAVTIRSADPWRIDPRPGLVVDQHALPFSLYSA